MSHQETTVPAQMMAARKTFTHRLTYVGKEQLQADIEDLINRGFRLVHLAFYATEQTPMLLAVVDRDRRLRRKQVEIEILGLHFAATGDMTEQLGRVSSCRTRIAVFPCGTKMLKVMINRLRDGTDSDILD